MKKNYKLAVAKDDGSVGLYDPWSGRVAPFPFLSHVTDAVTYLKAGKVRFCDYASHPAGDRWVVAREPLL